MNKKYIVLTKMNNLDQIIQCVIHKEELNKNIIEYKYMFI